MPMSKNGISYFPLDCQLDDKVELLKAQYGFANAFTVIISLFQKIYGGEGYYYPWTNDMGLLFSKDLGMNYNLVSDIVESAMKRGLFSEELYKKFEILTSKGIQERYFEIVKRRKKIEIDQRYLLVSPTQIPKNVCILGKNVCMNAKNVDIFQQRKGKERKGKESIHIYKDNNYIYNSNSAWMDTWGSDDKD